MKKTIDIDIDGEELRQKLCGSFLFFIKSFFPLITGRDFEVSNPVGRESHHIILAKTFTQIQRQELFDTTINLPPGHGKSVFASMFVPWCWARYPDSQFLYISYSKDLAVKHTEFIRNFLQNPYYQAIFGIKLDPNTRAKEKFRNNYGGQVTAFGSASAITGCFDYNAKVVTDLGEIEIGKLAENKIKCAAWSLNQETNKYELKKVTNWFENPANDIVKVQFSDGSHIECTPDHKIWTTNRGWVQAQNLNQRDRLNTVVFSDSSYNPVAKASNFNDITNSELIVQNSFKLRLGDFFDLQSMLWPYTFGNLRVCATTPNICNTSLINIKPLGYINRALTSKSKFANFNNIIFGELTTVKQRTMINRVCHVLFARAVAKIGRTIIKFISILMSCISLWRPSSNKAFCNKVMNKFFNMLVVNSYANHEITSRTNPRLKYLRWIANSLAGFINVQPLIASNSAVTRNAIPSIGVGDVYPVGIEYARHVKKTYCLEVEDNHNFIIKNNKSAIVVSNCDAGLPAVNRFSGAVIMDDMIKPDESHSSTIRDKVIRNYVETITPRKRQPSVPIISIMQRLHEQDLGAFLTSEESEFNYHPVILKGLDAAGNALWPEVMPKEMLLAKQEKSPYVFAGQYQQDPVPSGGALFKRHYFPLLDNEPKIIMTFITADTAETSKTYNDASAFSFWGLYEIEHNEQKTGQYALHWLDCVEIRVEPKDLESEFVNFYSQCMMHDVKPLIAAIEKKSTGVTLSSTLSNIRGLKILDIHRTKASGSKANRYLEMQPLLAAKLVSLPSRAHHAERCIMHMMKITANDSHAFDDICFIANTKIATPLGDIAIQEIQPGDKVITPFGVAKVLAAGFTKVAPVITKCNLTGTKNHPVYIENGFYALDTLNDASKISRLNFSELFLWRYKRLLSLMGSNTDSYHREGIILASQALMQAESAPKDFMLRFGNFITSGQYRKALLFITKTATILITTLKTLCVFHTLNTCKNIGSKKSSTATLKKTKNTLKKLGEKQHCGTKAKLAENGIVKTQLNVLKKYLSSAKRFALSAIKSLFTRNQVNRQQLAAHPVILQNIEGHLVSLQQTALFAGQNTLQKNSIQAQEIEKHAHGSAQEQKVYNLKTSHGVYYANGVLVSNCDTAYDACKLALIDKTLIYKIGANKKSEKDNILAQASKRKHQAHRNIWNNRL